MKSISDHEELYPHDNQYYPAFSERCASCGDKLAEPFVVCAVCRDIRLCVQCFSRGSNVGEHVSSHAYSIYSDRVPILVQDWEAKDERRLLDLILECGYGNWWDISRRLGKSMEVVMVEIYNSRLKERARRCRIVREHGLITPQKTYVAMSRFSSTLGRTMIESLAPFAQFLTGLQFDYFLEGLHVARELQERSNRLCELRSCGLKTFQSAKLMQKLSEIRAMQKREQKANNLPILQGVSRMEAAARNPSSRRPAPPLEIAYLPFYERLIPQERELCAHARIVPESFLEFKSLLAAECKKNDGLRLAQARRCIKIDVNKTRRLFDFLMEQGIIFPPKNK
ncbi:hypothetical protein B566_EDAN000836 [Ephemera danica]|nr:hypothetical protein B566_EDAN000836 [Ephemera danica]